MASASDPHDEHSPWTQRGFIVAAALVGAIALIGVIVAIAGGGGDEAPAQPAQSPPPVNAAPAPATGGSVCGLPRGDQDVPTAAPPDTRWELVGSMAAPQAPRRVGPGRRTEGIPTCFARSPLGALYAAVNFWASSTAKPAARVYEVLAADTALRDRIIREARKTPEGRLDRNTTFQVAAFDYVSYDPGAAALELVFRIADGSFLRVPVALRWERGDWKYVIAPDGESGGSSLSNLDGYSEWSGV